MPVHETLSLWENFYVIVGSSAGALTGLQFVVMALIPDSPTQAGEHEIKHLRYSDGRSLLHRAFYFSRSQCSMAEMARRCDHSLGIRSAGHRVHDDRDTAFAPYDSL